MEEENKEEVVVEPKDTTTVEPKKGFDFKSFNYKKYLPYAGIALAVIVLIIILVSVFGGGPKKAIKSLVSGMNSRNAKKVVNSMDIAGMQAWGSGWYTNYDPDDFDKDDYDEFIEDYNEIDKDDIKEYKEDMIDSLDDTFDDMKDEYKSFKIKVEKIKKVEKLGKNLYAVDAKISVYAKPKDKDEKEMDESSTMTFVVYKNKIISMGSLSSMMY